MGLTVASLFVPMKTNFYIILLCVCFWSCQKTETTSLCRLTKFVTEYPATKLIHHDLISLKDNRIAKMYSYDLRNGVDTTARQLVFFEYNSLGKVLRIRDETSLNRIILFDFFYGTNGNPEKVIQKVNNVQNNEIILEFDSKNRPTGAISLNLVGLNRSIEYDAKGNPFRITRADFGSPATINEHIFDDKRNFFEGIPEIGLYWLLRPLYNFLPFGSNNIVGTKFFTIQNLEFKEVPDNRTIREISYNSEGFPTTMSIILENQGKAISSLSKFEYNCE